MSTTPNENSRKIAGPADFLANERTFLSWIRTSIALMGFGFVIVKFALFIRQISFVLENKVAVPSTGNSALIGITMVAFGAILSIIAYVRYRSIDKQLKNNDYQPSWMLSAVLVTSIVIGAIFLVMYLIDNVKN